MASLPASAIIFTLLYAKYVAGNVYCGKLKRQLGGGPPEDRKFQTTEPQAPNEALSLKYARWQEITRNDTENLPLGVFAMFVSALLVNGDGTIAQIVLSCVWCLLRFLHTVAHARSGPAQARRVLFTLGVLSNMALVALIVVAAFLIRFN
jgi:hypothetical protein